MLLLLFDTVEQRYKFDVVYQKYKKYVLYTIKLFIQDSFVIEDLFQDISIIIAKNINNINIEQEKMTRNYVITITRNYVKNYLKKKKNHIEYISNEHTQLQYDMNLLENMIIKDAFENLKKEIYLLNEKYKTVLELKYIYEFCDEEIAQILGIAKKTVQMRLYRAKKLLRSKYKEK